MKVLTLALFLLLFTGCNRSVAPVQEKSVIYPAWMANPNANGLRGSIGSAYPHFKGPSYQRALAISRALDELAMEMGVTVNVDAKREERTNGDEVNAKSDIHTQQSVNNSNVTAHIEATFTDPKTNELFVWMVLD
jgi:hypothetical protein